MHLENLQRLAIALLVILAVFCTGKRTFPLQLFCIIFCIIFNNHTAASIPLGLTFLVSLGSCIRSQLHNPFAHLPTVTSVRLRESNFLSETPRGSTPLKWIDEYPRADLIRVRGLLASTLIVRSSRALRDILNAKSYDFEKPRGSRSFLARVMGFGLIVSEGDMHQKQRRVLNPVFHIKNVRETYEFLWQKTKLLLEQLELVVLSEPLPKGDDASQGVASGFVEMDEWSRSANDHPHRSTAADD
ncbi:MAG: hypothetical protein Q9162_003518 [Coniocarpon cinnabarinum]